MVCVSIVHMDGFIFSFLVFSSLPCNWRASCNFICRIFYFQICFWLWCLGVLTMLFVSFKARLSLFDAQSRTLCTFKISRCVNVIPNSLRLFSVWKSLAQNYNSCWPSSSLSWVRFLIEIIALNVGSVFSFCTLPITGSFPTFPRTLQLISFA